MRFLLIFMIKRVFFSLIFSKREIHLLHLSIWKEWRHLFILFKFQNEIYQFIDEFHYRLRSDPNFLWREKPSPHIWKWRMINLHFHQKTKGTQIKWYSFGFSKRNKWISLVFLIKSTKLLLICCKWKWMKISFSFIFISKKTH